MKSFANRALGILLALSLVGCGARQVTFGAKVTDPTGRPVGGALVYVEAWKHPGAYDFSFGVTDDSGRVSTSLPGALTLLWKPGTRLAYAAFAGGRPPFAVVDYKAGAPPAILHIQVPDSGDGASPKVAKLGFPFPGQGTLADRASSPETDRLRDAFLEAYNRPGMPIAQEDRPKFEDLARLQRPPGLQ